MGDGGSAAPRPTPRFYLTPDRSLVTSHGSRVLYDDLRERRGVVLRPLGDLDRHAAGDLLVDLRRAPVRVGHHGRTAGIGLLADMDVERQRPQQIDVVVLAHFLRAALAEDVLLVAALRADVKAHVLDDAEDGNPHLLEHL